MSHIRERPAIQDEQDPLEKLMKHTGCLDLHYQVQSGLAQATAVTIAFSLGYLCKKLGPRALTTFRYAANPQDTKLVLVVRSDLRMTSGKVAAQCSHAAVSCYKKALESNPQLVGQWETQGQPKIVVRAEGSGERALTTLADRAAVLGCTAVIVRDAGRTQIAAGSATVVGIGPATSEIVSKLTASLRLY